MRVIYNRYKTVVGYTLSSLLRAFTHLAAMFFVSRFVMPSELGYWTFLISFVTYASFINAGITNGLNRELPYALSKSDCAVAAKMVATAQSYLLFCLAVIFSIGGAISLFYGFFVSVRDGISIFGITILTGFTLYEGLIISTYRSNKAFDSLAKIQTIYALIGFATIVFIYFFGYWGMVLRLILSQLIFIYLLHVQRPFKVKPKFDKKILYQLLKVGIPIFILAYIQSSAATFDKILLHFVSGNVELGYYSFAYYAFIALSMLSVSLASYVYPKMTYLYGQTNDTNLMWKLYCKITLFVTVLMFFIAIAGYFSIPYLVANFFPTYLEAMEPMKLLVIAGAIAGSTIGCNILWAMKKWVYMSILQITVALLLIIAPYLMTLIMEDKAIGIAYGLIIAYSLNYILGFFLSYRATIYKKV